MRRQNLPLDLTLSAGLALWLMAAQGAEAEVIDLGAGAEAFATLGQTEASDHFLDGRAGYAKLIFPDREQRGQPFADLVANMCKGCAQALIEGNPLGQALFQPRKRG